MVAKANVTCANASLSLRSSHLSQHRCQRHHRQPKHLLPNRTRAENLNKEINQRNLYAQWQMLQHRRSNLNRGRQANPSDLQKRHQLMLNVPFGLHARHVQVCLKYRERQLD